MTTPSGSEAEGLLDGIVQLRFGDDQGAQQDLNAAEVAEVLQGMVEFTSQMAKAGLFGEGVPPELRVRPPQKGSFVIEALVHFTEGSSWAAASAYVGAGAGLGQAVTVAARVLRRTEATNFEYIDEAETRVKISWKDGTVNEVPAAAWVELNKEKKQTKKALSKIMRPLGDDVTRLEVRGASAEADTDDVLAAEPDVVLARDDYREAVAVVPDPEDRYNDFETEATLISVDFYDAKRWRIEVQRDGRRKQRTVEVEDRTFLRSLDQGRAVHKNDILRVKIRETTKMRGGRNGTDWAIIEVLSQ